MKKITFAELNEFHEEFHKKEKKGNKNQNAMSTRHFNQFLAECGFKSSDKIDKLIEKETYLLEKHKGEINPRYAQMFITKSFIDFLRDRKIETLPLLPNVVFKVQTVTKPFKFGLNQKLAFGNFVGALQNDMELDLHKLIILNIFFRIGKNSIAKEITTSSIRTEETGSSNPRYILMKRQKKRDIPLHMTKYARDVLLTGSKENDILCKKNLTFMDREFPKIIRSYGFKDTMDFKDTIAQRLVDLLGYDHATTYIGNSTPQQTRYRYTQNLEKGRPGIIDTYFPRLG